MTQAEFNAQLESILGDDFGLPACPDGMVLLKAFADKYPSSFLFIRPEDFINLDSEVFIGIPEWKVFTEHVIACPRCNDA